MDSLANQDTGETGRDLISAVSRLSRQVRTNVEVSQTLSQGELAIASALLYTVRPTAKIIIREILVCNTGAADTVFYFSVVIAGGGDIVTYRIFHKYAIATHQTLIFPLNTLMNAGETIYGFADAALVNHRISGVEITSL